MFECRAVDLRDGTSAYGYGIELFEYFVKLFLEYVLDDPYCVCEGMGFPVGVQCAQLVTEDKGE
jgi:hypothetical protein